MLTVNTDVERERERKRNGGGGERQCMHMPSVVSVAMLVHGGAGVDSEHRIWCSLLASLGT